MRLSGISQEKCPINSLLLVPWSKVNGNFRFVTSGGEIWSRRFASAARNDVNFMARPLNQISFFAILSVVSVKWIFFTAENWSERLWRLIKHRCIMRIDGSDNAYYVQLCYEKWYVRIENSDFSYTLQLTAISVHKPIVDKQFVWDC